MRLLLLASIFIFSLLAWQLDVKIDVDRSQVIFDKDQRVLSIELTKDDKFRYWRPLSEIAEKYKKFVIEKEDKYFYYHPGVNPVSLSSATIDYILGQKDRGGASTITMQLARLYYNMNTRSPWGKFKQVIAAFWLEFRMTKDSIFESYLNLIPMGRNIEGFETASLYYFRKKGANLSRDQFRFLTLLPQRPYLLGSFLAQKWDDFKVGWEILYPSLNFEESRQLLEGIELNLERPFYAPHFTRRIIAENSDKTIQSTLDLGWQRNLESILKNYIKSQEKRGIYNATSLVIDNDSGEVRSYIGSADFDNIQIHGQVDGLMADRSPGSTLKPFIYALSFQQGLYHPKSIVYDSPLPYRTPENYDRTYRGPITIESALITSRNIPAVYVNNELQQLGQGLYSFLDMIYPVEQKRGFYGSSIALGALEVNSWQLAELYSALANNGEFKHLKMIPSLKYPTIDILSSEASIMVKDILKKNPRPKYQNSQAFSHQQGEVYWKTGTSFGFRDAWAVGIWQNYTIVTWVGDFRSKSNPFLVGSISAAPLFFQIVDFLRAENKTLRDYDLKHLYHKNLSEVDVCAISGHLPNENCTVTTKTSYWPGRSPVTKCEVHKEILVSKDDGLRVCPEFKGETRKEVFEFFSSEKQNLYEGFGMKLKLPPNYHPYCRNYLSSRELGEAPEIISPKLGFVYLREGTEKAVIPLKARAGMGSKNLSWYLEEQLLGRSTPGDTITVNLEPGHYLLRVIDEFGRISRRVLKVK